MSTIVQAFTMRPYQDDCLSSIERSLGRDVWAQAAVVPTGGGKTVIFSQLPTRLRSWLDQFPAMSQRMLVLAHREELLDQAADKIQRANPDLRVGFEQGKRRAAPFDDVVIASVATLRGRRLAQFAPKDFRIVVVDEAHHTPADTYQQVLRYFSLVAPKDFSRTGPYARTALREWWRDNNPQRLLLGMTATPQRADAIGLEWSYQEIVFERTLRWMIDQGYLTPLSGYVVETGVNLDAVRRVAGDYVVDDLASAVDTPELNRLAVDAWLRYAEGRRTIVFSVNVQHAINLAAEFRRRGIAADSVAGSDRDRDDRVREFRNGDLDVLVNCDLLTEGVDIPEIECVILVKPTQSQSKYMQMIGRGSRLSPGKTDCIIIDCVGVARKHPLITCGDLFGLPAKFNANGQDLRASADAVNKLREQYPNAVLLEGLTPETLQSTITKIDLWSISESQAVNTYARLKWMEDSSTRFRLVLPERTNQGALVERGRKLAIEEGLLGLWTITLDSGESLGQTDTLAQAFRRAERWVQGERPDVWSMMQLDAKWRDRPPSEKQLRRLQMLRAPIPKDITRGMASDMLDRYAMRRGR
jgi:ATP-dependent helicase IRC3